MMKLLLGQQNRGSFRKGGHTFLAAAEEIVFWSRRLRSSASAEGVTGLAAPKRREKKCTFHVSISIYSYS